LPLKDLNWEVICVEYLFLGQVPLWVLEIPPMVFITSLETAVLSCLSLILSKEKITKSEYYSAF
jgi:hypothetical protein